MSTTFAVKTGSGELKPVAKRSGGGMWWIDSMAELLPDETKVEPTDNTAQGIYTIGDIKDYIREAAEDAEDDLEDSSWIKDPSKIERNKRNTIFVPLVDAWHKDNDFVEVTEWTNGEGWDITISDQKIISLHFTEFAVIKELIALLEKD
jgi:hypothetical protein